MKTLDETIQRFAASRGITPEQLASPVVDPPAPALSIEEARERRAAAAWAEALNMCQVPEKCRVGREVKLLPLVANWNGIPWAVVLLGPAGTGKTWQAVRLLIELCLRWNLIADVHFGRARWRPVFADLSLAVHRIKREFGTPEDGSTFERLCRAPILVLDDVGAERDTEFQNDQLSLILRARYNDQRATILTSNAPDISKLAEPRIASRLSEGIVQPVGGSDRRIRREKS